MPMRKNLDRFMNKPQTKIVILTLTNRCNLSCAYCYEHNKSESVMSLETALRIVEHEMTVQDGSNFVCLYYFGGEPFLAFEHMKAIHAYIKSKSWEKGWFAFATTNGTLVHGELQDWLHEQQDSMELYLSIDGVREMHNRNRSNSYDRIDIGFFAREYPFAKMTVTAETLPGLASGVIELHGKGFQVSANLGYGIHWLPDSPRILGEQLTTLMDYYLEHPELKPATILDQAILELTPGADPPKRFCGVGPLMKSYDTDGSTYPCHAFAPLCLGDEQAVEAGKLDFSCPLNRMELDEKCRDCPITGFCPTCYGINFRACGNVYHVSDEHCRMMRVQFLANAMFQYRRLERSQLDLIPEDELRLLRNIRAVQTLAD